MRAFATYVNRLERVLKRALEQPGEVQADERIRAVLDGQPSRELRRLVGLEQQRAAGAFFTASALAERALASLAGTLDSRSIIIDPACGAGDLLISVTTLLGTKGGLISTLKSWGHQLIGRDLQSEFARAAKLRLALAVLSQQRHRRMLPTFDACRVFPHIRAGCGLSAPEIFRRASHIVINPPFTTASAPPDCEWANGGVSLAALFMDACVRYANEGTRIVAILPEVLRSGERYRKWRAWLEHRARIYRTELLGQFDRWADIDVFALELVVKRPGQGQPSAWEYPSDPIVTCVAHYFDVAVGRVVPYRDPEEGPSYRYIHARILEPWGTDSGTRERRRHLGGGDRPPFVVVRRTSRAGQAHRAVGTTISGDSPVAVENHLLVLHPKDGQFASCHRLMSVLRSPRTDEWFNQRIRCRHLTVTAMRQLPWWPEAR
jgi:N-6 DNA Methylase